MTAHAIVDSPIGPLTIVGDGDLLTGLFMQLHRGTETYPFPIGPRDDRTLPAVREQLEAYFAGDLTDFDLRLGAVGTPFQQEVWAALRRIPYGRTTSYGALAVDIGRPAAVRAVGLANGRNPISIVVPCHRVIGADGSLTGYGGGLERKRFLLELEGSLQVAEAPGLW